MVFANLFKRSLPAKTLPQCVAPLNDKNVACDNTRIWG